MDAGELVPDELIVKMAADRLLQDDAQDGFILDGFPRTIEQANALEQMLSGLGRQVTAALLIDVPDEEVERRSVGAPGMRQGGPQLPRRVRSAKARGDLRPGRLAPDPARRRQAGRDPQASRGLPRADRAARRALRREGLDAADRRNP